MLLRRRLMQEVGGSRLPSEYQEVEYIQCTGTQYIDTGVIDLIGNKYEVTIMPTLIPTKRTNYFGANNGVNVNINNGKWQIAVLDTTITPDITSFTTIFAERQQAGRSMTINDETFIASVGTNKTNKFWIGKAMGWSVDLVGNAKFNSSKIYVNNELVRDFIPCYRKIDNVAGMYDIINNQFYANAGTGNFIVGEDI